MIWDLFLLVTAVFFYTVSLLGFFAAIHEDDDSMIRFYGIALLCWCFILATRLV